MAWFQDAYIVPFLTPVRSSAAPTVGVLLCPGGGYASLDIPPVVDVAKYLNSLRISAFVLVYR